MYLLFNNKFFINIILSAIVLLLQAYSPRIPLGENLEFSLDFLLVFITISVLLNKTFVVIFIAFFLGLVQDCLINIEAIGLCSFSKSLCAYYISKVKLNNNLWSTYFKQFYVFLIYFIHFMFYYFILELNINAIILLSSFLHSLFAIFIFYIINKFLFNSKLL